LFSCSRHRQDDQNVARLYLHIGINKTGTSAIQHFLSDRAAALPAAGLLYPSTGRAQFAHFQLSAALGFGQRKHYLVPAAASPVIEPDTLKRVSARLLSFIGRRPAAQQLPAGAETRRMTAAELQRWRDTLRAELLAETRAHPECAVVVSSEHFVRDAAIEAVRDFFRDFDCRVVVYLRRHDHWWASAYAQAVKTVARPPWPPGAVAYVEYSRQRKPTQRNYRPLLDRWAAVFGSHNLIVRPYEREQNQGGVVADFLRAIDRPALAAAAAAEPMLVNESLGARTLALIDALQRSDVPDATRSTLIKRLIEEGRGEPRSALLPPLLRRQLIDQHRDEYAYIARHYLGRSDGRLFLEDEPQGNEAWEAAPTPDPAQLMATMANLMESAQ
jgi:hypothetical protein